MAEKTWRERLDGAKKRKRFLLTDRAAARVWDSCAVGEHKGEYEGTVLGPNNAQLDSLGTGFSHAINHDEIENAEAIYKKIQAWFRRSAKRRKARQEA